VLGDCMGIVGYKSLDKDFKTSNGVQLEVGKLYIAEGRIKAGPSGNGYHMCKNIEDTFRYCNALTEETHICKVVGSGKIDFYEDTYYDYEIMAAERMKILKLLSREEVLKEGLALNWYRAERFVSTFKLNEVEIEAFKAKYQNKQNVLDAIAYYQEGKLDVYEKRR